MRGKKGLAMIWLTLIIGISLLGIFFLLQVDIPFFKFDDRARAWVNYILAVVLWFLFQAVLIFTYVKLGMFAGKGVRNLRGTLTNWSINVKSFLITKA